MILPKYWAVVPAAGIGKRFGMAKPKQYLSLHGKAVIAHTLSCLLEHVQIQKIVVAIAAHDVDWPHIQSTITTAKIITTTGGGERHHSVYRALLALQEIAESHDWVLVHDAVRPCLQQQELDRLMNTLKDHVVGGLLGIKVRDTLKKTDQHGCVLSTLDRENVWQAQTPQMFRYGLLREALEAAIKNQQKVTDEASAVELIGKQPIMVEGSITNIKITYPEDLIQAEYILRNTA